MSTLPEQFSAARKSQLEAQLNFFRTFTNTAVDSAQKVLALNFSATRASMEKSSIAVRQLLAVKDPRDLLALTTQTQDNFDSMLAYGRALFGIASGTRAELFRAAVPAAAPIIKAPVIKAAPVAKAAPVLSAPEPAPAPEPELEVAPVAAASEPVLAQAAPEPALVAEPEPAPIVAAPAPKPLASVKPDPVPEPVAKAKPVAKAASKAAGKAVASKPLASVPSSKQLDMLAPKGGKKK